MACTFRMILVRTTGESRSFALLHSHSLISHWGLGWWPNRSAE